MYTNRRPQPWWILSLTFVIFYLDKCFKTNRSVQRQRKLTRYKSILAASIWEHNLFVPVNISNYTAAIQLPVMYANCYVTCVGSVVCVGFNSTAWRQIKKQNIFSLTNLSVEEILRKIWPTWTAFKNPMIHSNKQIYQTTWRRLEWCVLLKTTHGLESTNLTKTAACKLQRSKLGTKRQMLSTRLKDRISSTGIRKNAVYRRPAESCEVEMTLFAHLGTNRWVSRIVHWRSWGCKRKVCRTQKK